jgi:hypothetical protein
MAKLKPGLSSGADSPVLAKKILELEEFKRNARLEIEAIKERLSETRKELKLAEKTPKKDNYPISNQELHSLVFNKN